MHEFSEALSCILLDDLSHGLLQVLFYLEKQTKEVNGGKKRYNTGEKGWLRCYVDCEIKNRSLDRTEKAQKKKKKSKGNFSGT